MAVIPWSEDPEVNRKNIEDALNAGHRVIDGEPGKVYRLNPIKKEASEALEALDSSSHIEDIRIQSSYDQKSR